MAGFTVATAGETYSASPKSVRFASLAKLTIRSGQRTKQLKSSRRLLMCPQFQKS
jgi:hypothetical protein